MKNKTKRREESAYDYEHALSIKVGKKQVTNSRPCLHSRDIQFDSTKCVDYYS